MVGPLNVYPWSTTDTRYRAFNAQGHDVHTLNSSESTRLASRFMSRVQSNFLIGPGLRKFNAELIRRTEETNPDLIWIEQGFYVYPEALEKVRKSTKSLIAHYTTDDFQSSIRRNQTRHYRNSIDMYDVHITTNALNIPPLYEMGAKKVIRDEFGYDPELHSPPQISRDAPSRFKTDIVFIGHWEASTEKSILRLKHEGFEVKVWGGSWERAKDKSLTSDKSQFHSIYKEDYINELASAKICLAINSKFNRNQSSGRTFEIPAVGRFMLAERTEETLGYFEEGNEAEYFFSDDELVEKCRYYLLNEMERETIATSGHERCMNSSYSYPDRVRNVLHELGKLMSKTDTLPTGSRAKA